MLFSVDIQADDTMISVLDAHDCPRARAHATPKDLRVKIGISSLLYQAELRISEIGFPDWTAIAEASSNNFSEGVFPHKKAEAPRANTGVGATAPSTMLAFSILSPFIEICDATPTTARALASRSASFW